MTPSHIPPAAAPVRRVLTPDELRDCLRDSPALAAIAARLDRLAADVREQARETNEVRRRAEAPAPRAAGAAT